MSSPLLPLALALSASALSLNASAAADFATCFSLTPNVQFRSGDTTTQIVDVMFNDQKGRAVVNAAGGSKTAAVYDLSGRRLLGEVRYGIAALGADPQTPIMTDIYTQSPEFPKQAVPGAKFKLTGSGERTNHAQGWVDPVNYDSFTDYTFVGFEDVQTEVNRAPRTFKDSCHVSASSGDERIEVWYAAGYGQIKFERYSGQSLLMHDVIDTIIEQ
jgi:hypothetical protein